MKRQWNAYELNQLIKHGFDPAADYDEHIPVEYITHHVEFYKRDFYVDEHALIPRPETEQIIDLGLEFLFKENDRKSGKLKERSNKKKIVFADVGTGSGAIGITYGLELMKQNYDFRTYLIDVSNEALEIAKKNVRNYNLSPATYNLVKSDLLVEIPPEVRFDIIFANLPYIPSERMSELDASVKNYEPAIALDGGAEGLELIRRLLEQAETRIKHDGLILLEVDDFHDSSKTSEFDKWKIEVIKDEFEKVRFWKVRKLNNPSLPSL